MRIRQIAVGFCIALMLAVCGKSRAADPGAPIDESAFTGKIKLAAVGDSITLGATTTPAKGLPNAYPAQLQRMLGDKYEVKNFGVSGRTLMSKGDRPYAKEKKFQASLDYKPDVVVIMLGTNDTKSTPDNWQHKADFAGDYKALIEKYAALESKPRIFLCRTCFVANDGFGTINEPAILEELPIIDALAREMNLGLINIHDAIKADPKLNDNVHPNNEGSMLLAKTVYKALTGKDYDGASTIVTAAAASAPAK